jgi:signal transduction histidine kinase
MDLQWWHVGAAANIVITVVYLAIAVSITTRLINEGGRLRDNPLATATAAIFLTCAVHHGGHPLHQLLPAVGADVAIGEAMRTAFNEPHVSLWDVLTAAVGVWYWTLRGRFPALVRGAALFEDLRERQRQALEIHDNIVQGLATAKLSFELDDTAGGMAAVESTLVASRKIISDLLGDASSAVGLEAGALRRDDAAGRPS